MKSPDIVPAADGGGPPTETGVGHCGTPETT